MSVFTMCSLKSKVQSCLVLPTVFYPGGRFLVRRAELQGIEGVALLGDEALVKVAAEAAVGGLHGVPRFNGLR